MDDSAIIDASVKIGKRLQPEQLIIVESTVSPGTTKSQIKRTLEEESGFEAGSQFFLAHCPERAIPGNSLHEMQFNDRIIGGINQESTSRACDLYKLISKGEILATDSTTAETVKLVENASRDVSIAFANETALICEKLGVNVFDVIKFANQHPRVSILQPGTGVGGHCLPIDPWFLIEKFSSAKIIPSARYVNDFMPKHVFDLVKMAVKYKRKLRESKIVILGLAYKADVDDTRESPSAAISHYLKEAGAHVVGYDPLVSNCDFLQTESSVEAAVKEADCLILVVNHAQFQSINWQKTRRKMRTPILLDGSNFFSNPPEGYLYIGLGKPREQAFRKGVIP
jgi:UDP-N-acetyl-D-mannosaminuronic acid dehydrogenase